GRHLDAFVTLVGCPFGDGVPGVERRGISRELAEEDGRALDRLHENLRDIVARTGACPSSACRYLFPHGGEARCGTLRFRPYAPRRARPLPRMSRGKGFKLYAIRFWRSERRVGEV